MGVKHFNKLIVVVLFSICSFSMEEIQNCEPSYLEEGLPMIGNSGYLNAALTLIFNSKNFNELINFPLKLRKEESELSFELRTQLKDDIVSLYRFNSGNHLRDQPEERNAAKVLFLTAITQSWRALYAHEELVQPKNKFLMFDLVLETRHDLAAVLLALMGIMDFPRVETVELFSTKDMPQASVQRSHLLQQLLLKPTDRAITLQQAIRNNYGDNLESIDNLDCWGGKKRTGTRSFYFDGAAKEIFIVVKNRDTASKIKTSLTFNIANPVVTLSVINGHSINRKLMRVNAVIAHDGASYSLSRVHGSPDTGTQWVTHSDGNVSAGIDGRTMTTNTYMIHLVEVAEDWDAMSIDTVTKTPSLKLTDINVKFDRKTHGKIARTLPLADRCMLIYTSKKKLLTLSEKQNGKEGLSQEWECSPLGTDWNIKDMTLIGDELYILTTSGNLAVKNIKTKALTFLLRDHQWADVTRVIAMSNMLVTFDTRGELKRFELHDVSNGEVIGKGWSSDCALEQLDPMNLVIVTPKQNVHVKNVLNGKHLEMGKYSPSMPIRNILLTLNADNSISFTLNPALFSNSAQQ